MTSKIRKPVVAGRFYAGSGPALKREVERYLRDVPEMDFSPRRMVGLVSPHAGYMCSAPTAAHGFKLLKDYPVKRAVVISPSHSDYFNGVSVYDGDAWETPLGTLPVDQTFCDSIVVKCTLARQSEDGHRGEHALEVQLPFLQVIFPDGIEIVPLTIGVNSAAELSGFGAELAPLIDSNSTIIIASSDLSHYYPEAAAHQKDRHLLDLLKSFDLEALGHGFDDQSLEACGLGPILVMLHVAKEIGNPHCRVLDYRTSGDTCGDRQQVVGYASAVVYE